MDPDSNPLRFDLLDDGGGPFSLSTTRYLTVNTSSKGWLDYELMTLYALSISLSEASNAMNNASLLYATQGNVTLQIRIVDMNEAPVFSSLPSSYRLSEESLVMTRASVAMGLGSYIVVNDEDFGNSSSLVVSLTSWLTGFGSSYFEVMNRSTNGSCRGASGHKCVLRLRSDSSPIDYDAGMRYMILKRDVDSERQSSIIGEYERVQRVIDDDNQGVYAWLCGCLATVCTIEYVVEFEYLRCDL
jgi:hypothetical protein